MPRYEARRIESKWQAYWETHRTFELNAEQARADQEKLYVLDMFPYPSGEGLHVGHPEGYTATDIVCRYGRMRGKKVLHPMGWDAFGLPAEEYAIRTGTHPAVKTYENIDTFRRQLKMLGFSYDWSREFSTTDPDYYRWTQWIFLQIFDTWYDPEFAWTGPDGKSRQGKGRPISELPIPPDVAAQGETAVRRYQDKNRLAYQHEAPVNWCPALGTVLANEEVIDGKSERDGHPVKRIPLRQWMLRITSYADRLANELEELNWPESIKLLQRNWIGRSEGAEVDFFVGDKTAFEDWKASRAKAGFPKEPGEDVLRIYTTRPDTLFGVTYMVLSPEHPAVDQLTTAEHRAAVDEYRRQASLKSDMDRTELAKTKSGVLTGGYAINPVNGQPVPVWIADYVLISYGTGAIMAVPAHDVRDWEFAVKFQIPITPVVQPPANYDHSKDERELVRVVDGREEYPFGGLGTAINSGAYSGLATMEFKARISADLAAGGIGKTAVNYRLRDWLFSRQRYWGEPFPIWHELDANGQPTGLLRADTPESLPIELPPMADFKPTGTPEPLLSKAPAEWLYKTLPDGTRLKRETNSMPQWAGSCWYYLRFIDPKNSKTFLDPELAREWLPVDLYVGGAEHAVLHLLYSRFWHKVLFDRGHVGTPEPFGRLVNQGMILGEAELTGYQDQAGQFISANQVTAGPEAGPEFVLKRLGTPVGAVKLIADQVIKQGNDFVLAAEPEIIVESRTFKMSKSRGNVINPDVVVREYGADALRLYEMFMGPLEATKPWNMSGVEGIARFLARVWRMIADEKSETICLNPAVQDIPPSPEQLRFLHKTIAAVTHELDTMGFNTAISRMMEFVNEMTPQEPRPKSILSPFVLLLSPLAPHLGEELWELLGHTSSLAYEPWPKFDSSLLVESEVEIPVQVMGKLRGRVKVPVGAEQSVVEELARNDANVGQFLTGKNVVKVIFVKDRMVNFVVK
ncbi:MAG: leuS [Planctomycetaceae bacterium]|nr:leuS [Planctomycetaceae bacterium]